MWMYDSRPCSRAPRPRSVTWTRARVVIVGRGADDRMAKRGRLPITRACVHVHTHTTPTHTHTYTHILYHSFSTHSIPTILFPSLSLSLSAIFRSSLTLRKLLRVGKDDNSRCSPTGKGRRRKKTKQPTTEKNKPNNNNKKGNFVIVDTNRNAIGVPEHGGMLVKEAGGCWKHAGPESMSRSLFSSAPRLAWPRPFSRDRVACGE